ncbi:MAG: retroviral-like aspartic protease family protein [Defluviitaleaceae bacterium]|nr:retroviral-like aspartic protease family protein [Defluviitaleaceae bacterium]
MTKLKMELFSGGLYIPIQLWSVAENRYRRISLMLDTGASVTTISPEIFHQLGYEPTQVNSATITTASSVERVSQFMLQSIKLGDIELHNVEAYAHKFPEESFAIGVVGLNVLRQFDIQLLFSQNLIILDKIID